MRYFNAFFLTTFIYVVLTVTFLFAIPFNNTVKTKEQKKKITLNYVQMVKPKSIVKEPKKEEKIEKKVVKKEEVKKTVEKIVKKKTPKKIKPKKKVKKTVKKQTKKIEKKVVKKEEVKKTVEKIFDKKHIQKEPKPVQKEPKKIEKVVNYKEDFLEKNLAKIKDEIQKHVIYSKRARKLNVEGKVLIEFHLTKSGEIINIRTIDGHRLLQKSAVKAVYSASVHFPRVKENITIRVPIEYRLI